MVAWTKEQQEAIDRSGSDILVAAAAGSGKTAVLVERIIKKLTNQDDPLNIDEILVATFTNAAAEEMRSRIGKALEEAITKDPTSYHLKKQLSLLQRASISTLHSFCTLVVRQYAYLLDLDPAFRIADTMELDLIKQEVMEEMFEDAYGQEGEEQEVFFTVVDMFSNDRSDVELEEVILRNYNFADQHPWPEEWLQEVAEMYNLPNDCKEEDLPWLTMLKDEVMEQFLAWKQDIDRAMAVAGESDGPYHYLEALEADMQIINQAMSLTSWDELAQYINSVTFKSLSRKSVDCSDEKKEKVKQLRDRFRKPFDKMKKDFFTRSLAAHMEDMRILYPVIKKITELVSEFKKRFSEVKRERAILDFSDLEHFALEILIDPASTKDNIIPSDIAYYYKNQFKEILVDEYQDINNVQETILSVVSDRENGNMFMVGDVKQSIYRFRHAEPQLFLDKYKRFAKDESTGRRIDLAKNFRSREEVLNATNYIFKQILDETVGEIDYDERAELIYGNYSYEDFELKNPETELIIINRDTEKTRNLDEESETVEELEAIQLEARLYAEKIKEWIGKKEKAPVQVIDKATNKQRNLQYRDIVILLRSLKEAPTITEEFKKQGIPVYAELDKGYFEAIEIQVMINMLKVIDNPFQDIPLASVLRSPIVGLNEEQLAQIRLMNRREPFYQAVRSYALRNQEASQIVQKFLEQLKAFREIAIEGDLSELIWQIYRETGYYDFVGGIPGGRQRQANLRALYDRARSYESTSFRGLFRFLRLIERMEEQDKDLGEARALSEQEDVVRMMTIHGSKGLEFPVVIIGQINKEFNQQDIRKKYILDKDRGFATKFIDPVKRITYPTLYYQSLKEAFLRKSQAEEMRVLYVAMTRAKEKLVMIGNLPSFEKVQEKWREITEHPAWILPNQQRKKAKTYLELIGPALIRHEDANHLRDEEQFVDIPTDIREHPSKWHIEVLPAEELLHINEKEQITKDELKSTIVNWNKVPYTNENLQREVDQKLSFHYPFQEAAETRAKQSVTEIKRRQEVTDDYSDKRLLTPFRQPLTTRPLFMQEEKELTPAEIGTAMHTVMQHIPLTKQFSQSEIRDFIIQLVEEEKLTEQEAEAMDVEAIKNFFANDIAQLIITSEKIEREVPFTYTLDASEVYSDWQGNLNEKVLIQGVVDCIVHTNDGIIILDYKTDAISGEVTEEVVETLKERYSTQVNLYKKSIEDILHQPVKVTYLYFFAKDLVIKL
ncbi:helicase-exonuclease AddAB subunit AddA [Pseudogracilibacillus sp. SO30301A]|uniref:helicase-exonuclease AddAB subunit AddA n=1 Tax=Pseudogracilibacillus sp. SO30301A TaxID=3098291 RepID=UPI00300E5A53